MKTVVRQPTALKPFGWNAFRHRLPLLDSLRRRRFALFSFFLTDALLTHRKMRITGVLIQAK
jgi:hypothetical protein